VISAFQQFVYFEPYRLGGGLEVRVLVENIVSGQ
jgi:hypothetical protein